MSLLRSEDRLRHRTRGREDDHRRILRLQLSLLPRLAAGGEEILREAQDDARFAFIEFPIKGPESIVAARVAMAARRQADKYLALHFALMAEQDKVDSNLIYADAPKVGLDVDRLDPDMNEPEIVSAIDASLALTRPPRSTAPRSSSSTAVSVTARWTTMC